MHAGIIWHLMLVTYRFLPFRYVICSKPDKLENLHKPEGIFIEVDTGELTRLIPRILTNKASMAAEQHAVVASEYNNSIKKLIIIIIINYYFFFKKINNNNNNFFIININLFLLIIIFCNFIDN